MVFKRKTKKLEKWGWNGCIIMKVDYCNYDKIEKKRNYSDWICWNWEMYKIEILKSILGGCISLIKSYSFGYFSIG